MRYSYAEFRGVDPSEWKWTGLPAEDGTLTYSSRKPDIGEARLWLKVDMPEGYSPL